MFNLFTPPCFAALGAMNSEISDRKWFWGGVALQFATGYVMSFAIYQIGTYVSTGAVGVGFMPGLVVVGIIVATLAYLVAQNDKVAETKLYFEKQ
jgi:ferrous iron transport protein B